MIIFDAVELLTEHHPHQCKLTVFKFHMKNGKWIKNPNFDESVDFAVSNADFRHISTENQIKSDVWVYLLDAPYKYRDIPCIAKALPKLDTRRKHFRPKPVDYDDLVAESLMDA